jgi:hypothetical protein
MHFLRVVHVHAHMHMRQLLVFAALAVVVPACGHDIGDDCRSSVDCDPNGTRACDLSQPGGYCTIAGCDGKSCPGGSTCIRYFPEMFLSKPCLPACEDLDCPQGRTDDCSADELCLDGGLCAKRSFETRACAKSCSSNSDCRSGYQCRDSNQRGSGSMVLATNPDVLTKFCAPAPVPPKT